MKVGTSFSGLYSDKSTDISTPYSSTARSSNCSIRKRCSALAISSRCTLEVNCSNSIANSRIWPRIARVSPSRALLAFSNRSRSAAALEIETSI